MAQVTGDTSYDWDWHHKWETALRSLRDLANAWAMRKAIPPAEAAAVIIRVLATPAASVAGVAAEPLSIQLDRVRTLERELARLCPNASEGDLESAAVALQEWMEGVREAWTRDGEGPDERASLTALAGLLFDRGLCPKPPKKGSW